MIPAGREERGGVTDAGGHFEAEHVPVKAERAFQVGHLEVDVTDAGQGMDRFQRPAASWMRTSAPFQAAAGKSFSTAAR